MIRSKKGVNDANPMCRASFVQSASRMGYYDMGHRVFWYAVRCSVRCTKHELAEPDNLGGRASHGGEGRGLGVGVSVDERGR